MASVEPLPLAKASTPSPPKNRQKVRKVQGRISPKAIFIIGQASPQKMDRIASRTKPSRGSALGSGFFLLQKIAVPEGDSFLNYNYQSSKFQQ